MKKIVSIGLMLCVAFLSNTVSAQELNDVVANHIKAIGGAENWSKVKSRKMEATIKAQGAEIKMTMNQVDKKGMRVDINVMGMSGYQILTDKGGWSYMPFQGQTKPEPMTADDVKSSQDDLAIQDAFITYKELGKKIEFLGKDDIEGTECFKISMTDKEGKMSTYYLDASNYQVIKTTDKKKMNGKEFETNTTYSNYKTLDGGIVMPMSQGGDMGEIEFTSIEVNAKIDEALFQPKEVK